jgi:hypothetical protein
VSICKLLRREKSVAPTGYRSESQFLGRPTRTLVTTPTGLFRLLLFLWALPYEILMSVVSSSGVSLILRTVGGQSDTTLRHFSSPVLFTFFTQRMIPELPLVPGSVYSVSKILVSITHVYIFRTRPDRPWGSPSLLYNGYWVPFQRVNQPGRGVYHPHHLAPRLKNEYSYTSIPHLGFRGLL